MTATKFNTKASEKQISFILDLLNQRELQLGTGQTVEQLKEQAEKHLTKAQATRWIERLKSLPRKSPAYRLGGGSEPEAGMYKIGDQIVRVYLGQQSGKMLAKELVGEGEHFEWSYLGKATRFIKADTPRLSLDEAKKFGRMTGTCCICARRLDNPESVDEGIGPVCKGKMEGGF
jgi:hypothetical protein